MRYVHLVLLGIVVAFSIAGCIVRTHNPHPGYYQAAPAPRAHCYSECASWGWRSPCYGCRPARYCVAYRRVCR
jgi:hypothetical protein